MARIRSVKPSLRTSRVVAKWPLSIRYFWVLIWGYLDDEGRGFDTPKAIAGDCFPLDDSITAGKVEKWLDLMAKTKIEPDRDPPLCRYEVAGRRYLHSVYWAEHQRPNRPSPSMHPQCPIHERLSEPLSESFSEPLTEPPLSRHVLELEGLTDGSRGAARESLTEPPLDQEPPRTCPNHQDDPDPPACRRCGDARRRNETWHADKRARLAAAPRCATHPTQPAHSCGSCRADRLAAGGAA